MSRPAPLAPLAPLAWLFASALLVADGAGCATSPGTAAPSPASPAASPPPATQPRDPLAGLDNEVGAIMQTLEVPGLAVAIVHDGKVVHAKGYGVRELGRPDTVGPDTVFAIASNTKAFVATAMGLLVDDGVVAWDDRVVDHLPDLKLWDDYSTRHIRIRDLLAHRSGLATWAGDAVWIGSAIDTPTLMKRLRHVPPDYDFRERYGYTNLMFVVAGEVIRAKTGKTWDAFVTERLLTPLGMTRTTSSTKDLATLPDVATPHMDIEGTATVIEYMNLDAAGAAGALNSSVADMAKWLQLQLGEGQHGGTQLVARDTVLELRVPQTPIPRKPPTSGEKDGHFTAYGLGWFLADHQGHFVVTHGGGLPGMISRVTLLPDDGLGIVVLTNHESGAAAVLASVIIDRFLGERGRDRLAQAMAHKQAQAKEKHPEPASGEGEPMPAAKLVGSYRHPLLGRAVVETAGDGLALRLTDHGGLDCPLAHRGGNLYRCVWSDPIFDRSAVTFEVKRGRVRALAFKVRPEFIDPLLYRFERAR